MVFQPRGFKSTCWELFLLKPHTLHFHSSQHTSALGVWATSMWLTGGTSFSAATRPSEFDPIPGDPRPAPKHSDRRIPALRIASQPEAPWGTGDAGVSGVGPVEVWIGRAQQLISHGVVKQHHSDHFFKDDGHGPFEWRVFGGHGMAMDGGIIRSKDVRPHASLL